MKGKSIRTLIIDAPASLKKTTSIIQGSDKSIEVLSAVGSVEKALAWLKGNPAPDLIFQNIDLADGSCFEIFNEVHVASPIIFMADCGDHAIEIFSVNAVDYLLRPLDESRIKIAIERAKERWRIHGDTPNQRQLAFSLGKEKRAVELADIAYIHTESKITLLVTRSNRQHPMDYSMHQVEQLVDSNYFFRINRQFIISRNAIKELWVHTKSRLKISLHPSSAVEPVVSSDRMPMFKKWLVGEPVE